MKIVLCLAVFLAVPGCIENENTPEETPGETTAETETPLNNKFEWNSGGRQILPLLVPFAGDFTVQINHEDGATAQIQFEDNADITCSQRTIGPHASIGGGTIKESISCHNTSDQSTLSATIFGTSSGFFLVES